MTNHHSLEALEASQAFNRNRGSCHLSNFVFQHITSALRNCHLNTASLDNRTYLNVEQEVDSTMEYISSMQAAGSSAQALAIISAMVLAITFAGGSYREKSQDIMATKRFASEIILVNSSAFSCALISLFMGVMVIIRSQSIVSPLFKKIAVYNDPSGQGNDFNNNNNMNDQKPGFLREEIMLRKWYVIVSSLLILFSTVLLVIGEVLDLVAISCGPPSSLDEVWLVLISYPIYTVLGVAFILWINRCTAK